jgi:hypothetical protein
MVVTLSEVLLVSNNSLTCNVTVSGSTADHRLRRVALTGVRYSIIIIMIYVNVSMWPDHHPPAHRLSPN